MVIFNLSYPIMSRDPSSFQAIISLPFYHYIPLQAYQFQYS
ncbi:MAG: hypothetical protein ACTSQO_10375 [Candidatus Helarchaeota archaeon]